MSSSSDKEREMRIYGKLYSIREDLTPEVEKYLLQNLMIRYLKWLRRFVCPAEKMPSANDKNPYSSQEYDDYVYFRDGWDFPGDTITRVQKLIEDFGLVIEHLTCESRKQNFEFYLAREIAKKRYILVIEAMDFPGMIPSAVFPRLIWYANGTPTFEEIEFQKDKYKDELAKGRGSCSIGCVSSVYGPVYDMRLKP